MKITREIRARASLEKRSLTAAEQKAGYIGAIHGVIPFNSDSVVLSKRGRAKPFVEQIAPEAFKRSLTEDKDIMANAGHTDDPLAALGRIGENLTVSTTATELRWEALVPDTQAGKDMMSLVDKKIITGTSFEFEVRGATGEKWERRDDQLDQRTILDARLIAFNPVTWPAYADSTLTVEMRRGRDARGYYLPQDEDYLCCDRNMTGDTAYALQSLGAEVAELSEALDYLRDNAAGAPELVAYATAQVAEAAAAVTMLVAFLAANGAKVPEGLASRAQQVQAEARTKLSSHQPDHDRERRFRILQLAQ